MPKGRASAEEFDAGEYTPIIDEHGIAWHRECAERVLNFLSEPWREGEYEEWETCKRWTQPVNLVAICHRCRLPLGDEGVCPDGITDGYHDKCRKHELVDRGLL